VRKEIRKKRGKALQEETDLEKNGGKLIRNKRSSQACPDVEKAFPTHGSQVRMGERNSQVDGGRKDTKPKSTIHAIRREEMGRARGVVWVDGEMESIRGVERVHVKEAGSEKEKTGCSTGKGMAGRGCG